MLSQATIFKIADIIKAIANAEAQVNSTDPSLFNFSRLKKPESLYVKNPHSSLIQLSKELQT